MSKLLQKIIPALFLMLIWGSLYASRHADKPHFYKANNPHFQYVGRIDFSNPLQPRFWLPGVYIKARFKGSHCTIFVKDELPENKPHNYLTIVIDDQKPFLVHITKHIDTIDISEQLGGGKHTLTICKATESGLGYVEFLGMKCHKLLTPDPLPQRKIEFIGNSITCGFGNDETTPCNTGQYYDHENAYMVYGPLTARALKAQWHISAVSGIGMIHSCCGFPLLMPKAFDKMDMRSDSVLWDFKNYIPDVVTICLGQNDGIQDSAAFCGEYVRFIKTLRSHYPSAKIICLNSPMADKKLNPVLKNYITGIVANRNENGDKNVYKFFFDKRFIGGCYGHPGGEEDRQLAVALTGYIHRITGW